MNKKSYKYKFSIIMSIYNVGEFLREAIDSIVNQTIGLEHIQIILVNDGSNDDSGEICAEYADKYKKNIKYVEKVNGGVASAKNEGLKYVEGKYVNFLDPDDYISDNTLKGVFKFFENHYNQVEMVSIPMYFFGDMEGLHPKYQKMGLKNRVINLDKEPHNFVVSSASSFYKKEVFQSTSFDEGLVIAEDLKFNISLLKKNHAIGFVAKDSIMYMYRKKENGNSLLSTVMFTQKDFECIINVFDELLVEYDHTNIPEFIMELVIRELRSRINELTQDKFDSYEVYKDVIEKFRKYISKLDKKFVATKSRYINGQPLKCLYLNELGKEKNVFRLGDNGFIQYDGINLFPVSNIDFAINNIEYSEKYIIFDFRYFQYTAEDISVVIRDEDGEIYTCEYEEKMKTSYDKVLGDFNVAETNLGRIKIPVRKNKYSFFYMNKGTGKIYRVGRMGLPRNSSFLLRDKDIKVFRYGYHLRLLSKQSFYLSDSHIEPFKYKLWSMFHILKKYKKMAWMRILNKKQKKYILCSDRPLKGNDNGEAVFKYIRENDSELRSRTYYVIDGKSQDYYRLKSIGNVVRRGSLKHKYLFLNAALIASSHLARDFFEPFSKKDFSYYADMFNYKFMWLQHGVTMNDISAIGNKFRCSVDYVLNASYGENQEFSKPHYFYRESDIVFSGMPRFDRLENREKQLITILSTWRRNLTGNITALGTNERLKNFDFKMSDYYKAYERILKSSRLQSLLKKNNLILQFGVHPGMNAYEEEFMELKSENVNIVSLEELNYTNVFSESKLLITDYSSILFDFAYLQKPCIYYQFDEQDFFGGHYQPGYFEYRKNGFGDVIGNPEDVIEKIEEYINNDFKLEEKYKTRILETFKYIDKNNCMRVVEKIDEIVKKG